VGIRTHKKGTKEEMEKRDKNTKMRKLRVKHKKLREGRKR
jgi:hypothetical protein